MIYDSTSRTIISLLGAFIRTEQFNLFGADNAWLDINAHMFANWDLYLISIMTLVFGMIVYLQRPEAEAARAAAAAQRQRAQAPAPAPAEAPAAAPVAAAPAADEGAALLNDVQ